MQQQQPCIITPIPAISGVVDHYTNTSGGFYHTSSINQTSNQNVTGYQQRSNLSTNPGTQVLPRTQYNSQSCMDNQNYVANSHYSAPVVQPQHQNQLIYNSSIPQTPLQVAPSCVNTESSQNVLNQRPFLPQNNQNQNLNINPAVNQKKTVEKSKEFNWVMLEEHRLPVILIENERFIAVKTIESKILSNFPNIFPEEIQNRPPIKSAQLQEYHVNLLNFLNEKHQLEYERFGLTDTMVALPDFIDFYSAVKKHYPHCAEKIRRSACKNRTLAQKISGWIQINNTVIPYVSYSTSEFLPVEVLTNAAKLVIPENLTTTLPEREVEILNKMCSVLRRKVCFTSTTKFVPLHFVQDTNKNTIKLLEYLPGNDPMKHAKFQGSSSQPERITEHGPARLGGSSSQTHRVGNSSQMSLPNVNNNNLACSQPEGNCNSMATTCHNYKKEDIKASSETKPKEIELNTPKKDSGKTPSYQDSPNTSTCHTATNTQKMCDGKKQESHVKLTTMPCCGKQMLTLVRNSGTYVLLEAVLRVFFPNLPLNDFINATKVFFGVNIPECTVKEEDAYKSMYGIPSMSLKCKKLLDVNVFQKAFPELQSMFQVALYSLNNNLKRKAEDQNERLAKKNKIDDVICID